MTPRAVWRHVVQQASAPAGPPVWLPQMASRHQSATSSQTLRHCRPVAIASARLLLAPTCLRASHTSAYKVAYPNAPLPVATVRPLQPGHAWLSDLTVNAMRWRLARDSREHGRTPENRSLSKPPELPAATAQAYQTRAQCLPASGISALLVRPVLAR